MRGGSVFRSLVSLADRSTERMGDIVARSIHCTVVEVPVVADSLSSRSMPCFQDLVPWADPYIVGLVRRLQRASDETVVKDWPDAGLRGEAPPPLMQPDAESLQPRTRGTEWPRRG